MGNGFRPTITAPDPLRPGGPGRRPWCVGLDPDLEVRRGEGLGCAPGSLDGGDGLGGVLLAQAPVRASRSSAAGKPVAIQDRPDLFYDPKESQTFAKVWKAAIGLRVRIMPSATLSKQNAAQYDKVNNVVHVSQAEFARPTSTTRRSTAHELYHVVQNRSVLTKVSTAKQRAALIDKGVMGMKEDEYVRHAWSKELKAEAFAWTCEGETLNHFERSQGKSGFPADFLRSVAKQRVGEFSQQKKREYAVKARRDYRAVARRHGVKL